MGKKSGEETPDFTAQFEAPASAIWMNACIGAHTGYVSPPQFAPYPNPPMPHSLLQYGCEI